MLNREKEPLSTYRFAVELERNRTMKPHQKGPLTTKLGRLVERASYADLFVAAALVLLGAATYYSNAPSGHALSTSGSDVSPGFGDALYFSLVTFTTLGYGDFAPTGFGKCVAAGTVVCGLFLTALLIGKFASERQQSTLLLLFTSDAQRRLDGFTIQLRELRLQVDSDTALGNVKSVRTSTKLLAGLLEAVFNYLIFNANQARLIEFGNLSALNSLYLELQLIQQTCIAVHMRALPDVVVSDRTIAIAIRLAGVMETLLELHRSPPTFESYTSILMKRISRLLTSKVESTGEAGYGTALQVERTMREAAAAACKWTAQHMTAGLLQKIYDTVPSGAPATWPKDLHKQVAQQLGISNSLAARCIASLVGAGRLPK